MKNAAAAQNAANAETEKVKLCKTSVFQGKNSFIDI